MKTILIIDTQWIGHIPMYHTLLVERLLALNFQVISITPKPKKAQAAVRDSAKLTRAYFTSVETAGPEGRDSLTEFFNATGPKKLAQAVDWWERCRANVDRALFVTGWSADLVFFPGIENNIISPVLSGSMVDRIFRYKWCGLYLTPKYLRKPFLKFQHKRLFRKDRFFRAKNCVAVAVLDENVVERLNPLVAPTKVVVMPDFTNTEMTTAPFSLINDIDDESGDRKVIGLLGELSKRKGLVTLIDTAKKAQAENKPWFFVFAGPLNERNNSAEDLRFLHEKIKEAPKNCLFRLNRIEDEGQFNRVFSRCDVIFASYEKFYHSSNLLTKAAAFKKPVIVSKGHCMEERVARFNLGIAVSENNIEGSFKAINDLIGGTDAVGNALSPHFEAYSSRHSMDKLDSFLEEIWGMAQKKEICMARGHSLSGKLSEKDI